MSNRPKINSNITKIPLDFIKIQKSTIALELFSYYLRVPKIRKRQNRHIPKHNEHFIDFFLFILLTSARAFHATNPRYVTYETISVAKFVHPTAKPTWQRTAVVITITIIIIVIIIGKLATDAPRKMIRTDRDERFVSVRSADSLLNVPI